jgi:hypothetical protein
MLMSDCHWEEENLSVFVDGELPAGQQRSLARHLLECPDCAAHAGRLLAVKYYLGAHSEAPAPLGAGFWGRLDQALDLVDAVVTRPVPRTAAPRPVRRAWTLAGAGAFFILVAWVLRLATLPLPVQPADLIRAHERLLAQVHSGPVALASWAPAQTGTAGATLLSPARLGPVLGLREPAPPDLDSPPSPGSFTPAARVSETPARAGRTWLPQARLDQTLGAVGITQHLYSVPSLPVSAFTIPSPGLARAPLRRIRLDGGSYYVSAGDPTSLVAWRENGTWRVLIADTPLSELLSLAQVFSHTDAP